MFDYWHAQRAWGIGLSTYLVDKQCQVSVIVSFEESKKGRFLRKKSSLSENGLVDEPCIY